MNEHIETTAEEIGVTQAEDDAHRDRVTEAAHGVYLAIGKLVAAEFYCPLDDLAQSDLGAKMRTGKALVSFAGSWPDWTLRLALHEDQQPVKVLVQIERPASQPGDETWPSNPKPS